MNKNLSLLEFDDVLLDGLIFCSKAYNLFEKIRASEGGRERLRMRSTHLEKKLLEELFPICKYVQSKYRAGRYIKVRWLSGNQQFDAELIQDGGYINQGYFPEVAYIEVTCVMHPNEYLSRELINTVGFAFGLEGIRRENDRTITSEAVGYTNLEFIQSYSTLILDRILKKSKIEYPVNTSLVIQCSLNTIYSLGEWESLVALVRNSIPLHNFCEIFLYDAVGEYSANL